ncbi:hypothetical protein VCEC0012_001904B, partial [Vibrio cholerae O1 str. EC-0012]
SISKPELHDGFSRTLLLIDLELEASLHRS